MVFRPNFTTDSLCIILIICLARPIWDNFVELGIIPLDILSLPFPGFQGIFATASFDENHVPITPTTMLSNKLIYLIILLMTLFVVAVVFVLVLPLAEICGVSNIHIRDADVLTAELVE